MIDETQEQSESGLQSVVEGRCSQMMRAGAGLGADEEKGCLGVRRWRSDGGVVRRSRRHRDVLLLYYVQQA